MLNIPRMFHYSNNIEDCNLDKHSDLHNYDNNLDILYRLQSHQVDRIQEHKKYNSSFHQNKFHNNVHKAHKFHHANNNYQSMMHKFHKKNTQSNLLNRLHIHLKINKSVKCIEYKCCLGNLNIGSYYKLDIH